MFDKSKVICRAHNICKETNCKMSNALREAWIEVRRLTEIDNRLFDLNMIDFQSSTEKMLVNKLSTERTELNNKLNPKTAVEIATQAEKNRLACAIWEEAEDIHFELGCIIRSNAPDWERHKVLRARLKEIA